MLIQAVGKSMDERSVSAAYSQPSPQEGSMPLRLLNDFSIFFRAENGSEQLAHLEGLKKGDPSDP